MDTGATFDRRGLEVSAIIRTCEHIKKSMEIGRGQSNVRPFLTVEAPIWDKYMAYTSEGRLSNELRQKLEQKLLNLLSIFRDIKNKLGSARSFAHKLFMLSEPGFHALVFDEVAQQLRETGPHKELVDFLLAKQILWDEPLTRDLKPSESHMYRLYVGSILVRILASADEDTQKSKSLILEFIEFLDLPNVPRRVNVTLLHLDMAADSYDLSDFGTLTKSPLPSVAIPESPEEGVDLSPLVVLSFTVRTRHFCEAHSFPLSDTLKAKVGLLRLAVWPLIGYNHFSVEHIRPWELKISDDDFSGRHWSKSPSISQSLRRHVVTSDDGERIMSLRKSFDRMDWERVSSWRLAMDRLDDASFKLECGSPDAILDLVIGLESVFVDRDSRQESTHKVAVRASRFLEPLLPKRREMFRKLKQIYKDRSTLAHGQRWNLDDHAVARVEDAANILAGALYKMVELESADLDHDTLDLA